MLNEFAIPFFTKFANFSKLLYFEKFVVVYDQRSVHVLPLVL